MSYADYQSHQGICDNCCQPRLDCLCYDPEPESDNCAWCGLPGAVLHGDGELYCEGCFEEAEAV